MWYYLSLLKRQYFFTCNIFIFINFSRWQCWYFCCSSLILSSVVSISFYILSKRFFLKRKGLSDAVVPSATKKEYGFAVQFLQRFIKSLKSISNEWLYTVCSSYYWTMFFIIMYISNHIIKYGQYFAFLSWIVFFNISINILQIIWVLSKSFRII